MDDVGFWEEFVAATKLSPKLDFYTYQSAIDNIPVNNRLTTELVSVILRLKIWKVRYIIISCRKNQYIRP